MSCFPLVDSWVWADKFFAIPWQAFSLRPHERAFLLDIPRDVLEKAEGFDKDQLACNS